MPATVTTPATDTTRHSAGDSWRSRRNVVMGAYATGGVPVTAALLGMNKVTAAQVHIAASAVAVHRVNAIIQTDGSILLKAYAVGMIAEVADLTDLSGTTVVVDSWGTGS